MFKKMMRKIKREEGFNMIELMVVVVIVGILAAIAVPIYSKYVKSARVSEATGRVGDLLTAAKAYAAEHETDGNPATANWPADCAAAGFVGDCSNSANFSYTITGVNNGLLTITATGSGVMNGVTATMTITNPSLNGSTAIAGL